jgi:hypothetical protein
MKLPTMLIQTLVKQFARDLDLSAERDLQVIADRVEHEGLSFLTITLPSLSDSLERGLESGRLTCSTSFSRQGSLPHFLGGFFRRVFDRDGRPLPEPCVDSIRAIRQICRFFKKPRIACNERREADAIRRFKEVEGELFRLAPSITARKDIILDKVSRILWSQVIPEPDPLDLVCHHGPGVTADRRHANQRHDIRSWYTRAELLYPSDLHAYPNYGWACESTGSSGTRNLGIATESFEGEVDRTEGLEYYDVGCEPAVRVVFVPKTLKTPRVIAIEPSSMQYIQQSLLKYIVPLLESHPFTRNSVRFSDQSVNQRLARLSSIDRRLATLDLKDASDRVSLALVQRIFSGTPILDYLEAARSLHADLPDGSNVILNKYASMGSALCFPVEAMVFYTIIQAAIHDQMGIIPTNATIKEITHMIDIYGDDIIVPIDFVDVVVRNLEAYGLKVNLDKSFTVSHFRESCGGDFFKGIDVKPIYAREIPPEDGATWEPNALMSWASTRNQFYMAGLWDVVQVLDEMLHSAAGGSIPRSQFEGSGIVLHSLVFNTNLHWDKDFNGWKHKRLVFTPKLRDDTIDGLGAACLMKALKDTYVSDKKRIGTPLVMFEELSWFDSEGNYHMVKKDIRDPDFDPYAYALVAEEEQDKRIRAQLDLYNNHLVPQVVSDTNYHASTKRGVFGSKHRWIKTLS